MRLKKNEAALGLMTLILIGTTLTSAYFGVKNSQNVQARATAEKSLLDTEKKLQEKQDGNERLLDRVSSMNTELQQLQSERDELSLSLNNYQEMVERGAAKSDQSLALRIAQKNLLDLQRRNQENELFADEIREMLNVTDNEAALAVFTKLINGEQVVIGPRGQLAKTDEAQDKAAGNQATDEAADAAPQLVAVTPPPSTTESHKPVADQADADSVADLTKKIAELTKMVTKRERLLREQGELIERLKKAEASTRIQTAKPSLDDSSADAIEVTTNQGFRSGRGVTTARVITSVEEDAASVSEVFIPAADYAPGIEAFDGILQPYSETIILP